jgi:hypothetical protein
MRAFWVVQTKDSFYLLSYESAYWQVEDLRTKKRGLLVDVGRGPGLDAKRYEAMVQDEALASAGLLGRLMSQRAIGSRLFLVDGKKWLTNVAPKVPVRISAPITRTYVMSSEQHPKGTFPAGRV